MNKIFIWPLLLIQISTKYNTILNGGKKNVRRDEAKENKRMKKSEKSFLWIIQWNVCAFVIK
jgi:hypothetical protein